MLTPLVRLAAVIYVVAALLVAASPALAQNNPPPRPDPIRMFLDCSYYCDEQFLRKEITLVDWVRDRKDADVHVLVTTQSTGGGGTEYTFKFIGLGPFASVEQTLKHAAPSTATSDETRKAIAEVLKRGLVRYIFESPMASRVTISFSDPKAAGAKAADAKRDPWNLWVFQANVGGSFSGEQSTKYRSFRGSGSANRTTDDWKLSFSASGNYSENKYDLSDTETYTSTSRNSDVSALAVKSLTGHWSAGLVGSAGKSIFLNYDLRSRIAPGLEYDVFPYKESTRRLFTVQYTVGLDHFDYKEITIYEKEKETLIDHKLVHDAEPPTALGYGLGFSRFHAVPHPAGQVSTLGIWQHERAAVQGILVQHLRRGIPHPGPDQPAPRRGDHRGDPGAAAAACERVQLLHEFRDQLPVRVDLQQHRQSPLRRRWWRYLLQLTRHRSLRDRLTSTSSQISTLCVSFSISEPTTNVTSATTIG